MMGYMCLPHNKEMQPTVNPLRGLSAAELGRYAAWKTHETT